MTKHRRRAAKHAAMTGARRIFVAMCAGLLVFAVSTPGFAQRDNLVAPSQPIVSLQQAVTIATSMRPGRVVRAVTVDAGGGRQVHEVRILQTQGGRVVTVRVDAQTGRVR